MIRNNEALCRAFNGNIKVALARRKAAGPNIAETHERQDKDLSHNNERLIGG